MNKSTILAEFKEFTAIESVSTDPNRYGQILQAVEFIKKKLSTLGFKITIYTNNFVPPLIIASKIIDRNAQTMGVYAHYDVQPEDPVKEWKNPPFELTKQDGRLYGRGVADDKGHLLQAITAVESLINENKLKQNIIFLFEGEEEIGSTHFEEFIDKNSEVSLADVFYVLDTGMHKKSVPQIFYGLRGIIYFELDVQIGTRDLHSGIYGNRVHNPINLISDLLASIKDYRTGTILIPHFYDQVRKVSQKELNLLAKSANSDREELVETDTFGLISVDKKQPHVSPKIYPSFDAHGICGGYTGPGSKTVIPKSAFVKFSFRLVEDQDPDQIEQLVRDYIDKYLPKGVHYTLNRYGKAAPFYTSIDDPYTQKTAQILQAVFGHEPLFNRAGGSIPASEMLQRKYKKPIIVTGFTLPNDNVHAPNENVDEEMFWKGIEALKLIFSSH